MNEDQEAILTDIEPEGLGHLNSDEPHTKEQENDPQGQNGPSYEANQIKKGKELNPGGSTDPNNHLSHADQEVIRNP